MKLVMFINDLAGGGAERVTATLGNYWARKQWDVTIVTLGPQSLDFYALDPAVRRISLNLSGNSNGALDGLRQNFRRVIALRRIIKQLCPQVALSMMSTPNVLMAFASIGIADLCVVGAERCYPPNFPLGRIWNALRQRMYGRLSAVVALTQECADWIKENSSARLVSVIPNTATWPLPDAPPRIFPETFCLPGRRILLAVGRLSKEKNFDLLIDVFAELGRKHTDWDLVILGEGPERKALEARIPKDMNGKRIFIPGIAGNVGQWYARADLFAMSSAFEGFPNALAEALAHGLPAVSFDCDTGPRDIIRHGVDGLLVPTGNVKQLQAALDRVMADSAFRRQLAMRAIDARGRFSIEKVAGMWESLFSSLADTRSASEIRHADPAKEGSVP